MKKILLFVALLCLFLTQFASAAFFDNEIDKYIFETGFELKSTVSIMALDRTSNKVIYKKK